MTRLSLDPPYATDTNAPQLSAIRVTSSKEKIQLNKLQNPINIRLLKLESRVAQSTEVITVTVN